MIVRSSGNDIHASLLKAFAQRLSVLHYQAGVLFELRLQGFLEAYRFGSDHMHKRSALDSREYRLVKVKFLRVFRAA